MNSEHQREISICGYRITLRSFLISLVLMLLIALLVTCVSISVFNKRPVFYLENIVSPLSHDFRDFY